MHALIEKKKETEKVQAEKAGNYLRERCAICPSASRRNNIIR